VLGVRHIYGNGPVDPEGLLSTLPAAATALVGVVVGRELRSPSRAVFRRLVAAGLGLAAAGWAWSLLLPMNKRLWTSSFAMFTAGAGVAAIGALLLVADRRPDVLARRPLRQARSLGANALLLYLLAEELIAMAGRTSIGSVSARAWLWRHSVAWWSGPMLGSLLYSLALLAVLVWVASTLERRRLHVRL
jgi:predicted acyltransferase